MARAGGCCAPCSHLGTQAPFSHGSISSQEDSTSPSASGWQIEREREREREQGAAGGIIGAGLEVMEPISAHVFWPQVRHSAPSVCERAQGQASRREGKGIWGTSFSCLSPQRGPCKGGGRALLTALPCASHREGELIRQIADGRSKQGGSQAYIQEGPTLRQRVCWHCEPPLGHQSAALQ